MYFTELPLVDDSLQGFVKVEAKSATESYNDFGCTAVLTVKRVKVWRGGSAFFLP